MFLTSASKFNIEPNGGFFDVKSENDGASLNMKTPCFLLIKLVTKIFNELSNFKSAVFRSFSSLLLRHTQGVVTSVCFGDKRTDAEKRTTLP